MSHKFRKSIYLTFLFWFSAFVHAQTADEIVQHSIHQLTPLIESRQEYYTEDPEQLYSQVSDLLGTFFDFDGLAKGVMGKKNFTQATDQQKSKFAVVLQRSMVTTLTDGLISLGSYSTSVSPARQSKPNKAKVSMSVTTEAGASHKIIFSLTLDNNQNWLVRNVVFDGVNIGLTFRSQLANEIVKSGSLDAAINNWTININET
ncbi:MAG: ABC transporter substrate-binding protein [Pseudomonadales bacterium]|nr:ABC transporter substrate-binding protein [Pseudomonadales bacterium]